jgi:PAS domain S-box-containing protein
MKAKAISGKSSPGEKSSLAKDHVRAAKTVRSKRVRPLAPKQFVEIIEYMNDGVVVLDEDWHYVYVNQKAAAMLQRQKPSDLIGKHIWTEFPEGVGQPFHAAYEKAMREQVPLRFEDHYEPWDLWFENRLYPSPDRLLILFSEITERKRVEKLLNEHQYLLQKILDTEPGTVYIYDLDKQSNVYVNRHWLLAFGYTEEETRAMGGELLAQIFHPEDLPRIAEHHENWRQADEGDIREIEYRVRTKAGDWCWLHSHEAPFAYDQSRRVTQILGISYEVTPRRVAQEALRQSEEKFSKVFHASPIPLSISHVSDGRFADVNESFLQRLGYERHEVIGRSAQELGVWADPAERETMMQNLSAGRSLRNFETQFRTKSGELGTALLFRDIIEIAGEEYIIGTSLDITERKQMERTILRERDFSQAMLNSLPGILYFYDQTGKFLRWNRNMEVVSGYSSDEIAHMHPLDFFTGEEKALVAARIDEVFERGESTVEANLVSKSNPPIPYYFTGRRIELEGKPYLIGMGIDISERKRAEAALATSELELRALFSAMNDVVLAIDSDGIYQKVAPTNPRLLYRPRKELLGKSMRDIFPVEQAESFINSVQWVIRTRNVAHIEYPLVIEGETLWFDASVSPMEADSVLWMARDITGRKGTEEKLRQLNEDLEQRVALRTEELASAMEQAQEADRLKSAFLASMSHELRTPLNSIIGFTGVLVQGLAGPLNGEQIKQLGMARDSARHLLALINDVLDISKIEAGQLEIMKQPFDMRQAIESALRVVHPLAQKKKLALSTSVESGVGVIDNDRRRVEQVLINLLNNAIKFTEHGEVHIACEIEDRWLVTSVRDSGIGIKPEDGDRLFKPFQQVDTGPARGHEGTGLGLAICKRLVTAMGGEISYESQWGVGSTFRFTLPQYSGPHNLVNSNFES